MSEKTLEIKNQKDTENIDRVAKRRTFVPAVDIYEFDNEVIISADMPGVDENRVDITLEKNILTIKGSVNDEKPENRDKVYYEYSVGDYKRTFSLSDEIDSEGIRATVKNGVLRLNLPKAEQARIKKITVQSAG